MTLANLGKNVHEKNIPKNDKLFSARLSEIKNRINELMQQT